jgi:uncharacterized membrane protein YeaQ/YmgE (transglycosylase-associated protein family)
MYFLLPDTASAQRTMDDLLLLRIEERHIHFVAKPEISMAGLHEANVLQTTDLVHGAKLGAVIGALAGFAAGWLVQAEFVTHHTWQIVTVLGMGLFGALFGAWAASMAGSSMPNTRLRKFEADIAAGRILLMVDVPERKVEEIKAKLGASHPEAADRGLEPNIPAFP